MNVILNITTSPLALPTGITAGQLSLAITDVTGKPVNDASGNSISAYVGTETQATFVNVAAGDYLATAVRLDTNGNAIGTAITQSFTVPHPTVATYDAPQSITVTLA
ncbi:MAG: hypothetical protein NVSMB6_00150 [Burkholderiaceae bacterium]